ncbi:RNB domain-containing ribonuclease [Rhodococcus sp. NPDC056960]|uniref:RNB domain-containing ribonuclease n=1 Tax=Rhodococcus sp. NPDC056960 TaxID=3345982 RepID=UPI00362F374E
MSRFVARGIDFGTVRTEFHLPAGYPPAAVAQARASSDRYASEREDRTDLAFVTVDPPDSMDLDQALHLERTRDGFVLHYAIADVGAVVEPGGALDVETRKRGQTFYLPDGKVPLHPKELSEGSASLLPDVDRPAVVWRIELDGAAEPLSCTVSRATVRSVARLDYAGVQADSEAGRLHPSIAALPEFGRLRIAAAVARGAIELRLPEQEVVSDGDGWRVDLAPRTDADDWNAEVSLLTGMCAATMMLDAKVGLLRTLPPAGPDAVEALRRTAAALGIDWPDSLGVGELLARLDANSSSTLVLMTEAPSLLRGADYAAFDGTVPELTVHAAIGAPYAHVTAPLRRLSDRYSTEVCLAVSAGRAVPAWARKSLGSMPEIMGGSDSLAGKIDRACIDLTEATLLADRVGETFDATVLRSRNGKRTADVFVPSVSVMAKCVGDPTEGEQVKVRLVSADVAKRSVEFGYPA